MDDDLSDPLGPSAPILPASAADLPPAGVAAATGGGAVLGGGAFEGANRFDALATWQPSIRSADAELLPDKPILDARVRDTLRNDAYVAGGATLHKDNIVGSLFLLNAKPETKILWGARRRDLGARVPGGGRGQVHPLGGIAVALGRRRADQHADRTRASRGGRLHRGRRGSGERRVDAERRAPVPLGDPDDRHRPALDPARPLRRVQHPGRASSATGAALPSPITSAWRTRATTPTGTSTSTLSAGAASWRTSRDGAGGTSCTSTSRTGPTSRAGSRRWSRR